MYAHGDNIYSVKNFFQFSLTCWRTWGTNPDRCSVLVLLGLWVDQFTGSVLSELRNVLSGTEKLSVIFEQFVITYPCVTVMHHAGKFRASPDNSCVSGTTFQPCPHTQCWASRAVMGTFLCHFSGGMVVDFHERRWTLSVNCLKLWSSLNCWGFWFELLRSSAAAAWKD